MNIYVPEMVQWDNANGTVCSVFGYLNHDLVHDYSTILTQYFFTHETCRSLICKHLLDIQQINALKVRASTHI